MDLRIKTDNCLRCKGKVSISEKSGSPFYRTAYDINRPLIVKAELPRQLGAHDVRARFFCEETAQTHEIALSWSALEGLCDIYTAETEFDKAGLYFYRVEFESATGTAYTARSGYYGQTSFDILHDNAPFNFQLTISDFAYEKPSWIYGGIIYHVFVDRFFRSSDTPVRSDAVLNEDWDNGIPEYPAYPGAFLRNNVFFGGNLYGVAEKLDHIASLGVNCIYLSPIFEAYSNHKYDTGNYMKIDDMFGGEKAFSELLEKARSLGIRIILDGVFNHTGADSIYFNKFGRYDNVGAYQSEDSAYYKWFDFQVFPDKYTSWWGIGILPRINPNIPECEKYFVGDDGVIEHYAKCGVGGFRLDVADELSDSFIGKIKTSLSKYCPDSLLYGEVWEDASNKIAYDTRKKYYLGKELDGVMNYPLRKGIIDYFRYGDCSALYYALCEVMPNCPKRVLDAQMNLLGTHDTMRILTALAAPAPDGKQNDELAVWRMDDSQYQIAVALLKNAYLAIATLPGVPAIFYGDEVGMQGYSDPFNRLPFPWKRMDNDLLDFYREVGRIRRSEPLYAEAEFALLRLDNELFCFARVGEEYSAVTVINRSAKSVKVSTQSHYRLLFGGKSETDGFFLESNGGCVFKCTDINSLKFDFQ